ncbi:beta and beta-prime subunits of DNA dependent RNA-polymerase [Xylona heveae TC161]|uniref:DNA-directed RNA polymerase subunit beta n=1 Tax=Xylona heveae (strain CBS 132557 / TC161) TaxID=1328760 RepID=A0A165GNP8_XYLHT|nr:beta and beta-prime subunits of DNA dependent RNA-polymerase [Xylona heveae TC161]KZF22410.1 beta and beta-prime subunits of DNA dependent RNA-polymerase [Xylona heveae TC161]
MAPSAVAPTNQSWSVEYDTVRREKLFRDPPKDRSAYPALQEALQPHIESFNRLMEPGGLLEQGIKDIGTKVFLDADPSKTEAGAPSPNRLSVRVSEVFLEKAAIPPSNKHSTRNREIYPSECRERHATYRGKLRARVQYRVNNGDWQETIREMGQVPIMLMTNRCHLENCSPAELVQHKEESEELGGYFIVNGIEKLIRMLIVSRRNYPLAIVRPSFQNRGSTYSKYGISIRSVRPDQTSQTNVVHYLTDGNATFRFSWRKNEFLVPVMMILKALVETNDREIFEEIVGSAGSEGVADTFLTDRVELLLRTYKAYGIHSKAKTRAYLGEKFRIVLGVPDDMSDEEVGNEFLRKIVLPHLGSHNVTEEQDKDKFKMLLFMVRKLYALVAGTCAMDNPDAVSNQEILLGGFLYGMILKEKLDEWLSSIRFAANEWLQRTQNNFNTQEFLKEFPSRILKRTNENIGGAMEYFLSTGNLVSPSGLDLQQTSGYTVVAEKINFYRFISHFRMVHRGSFFAQLKTTTVRKLLPESWGFLCPVHTPDGSPCGLLNHLAHKCKIATSSVDASALPALVSQLGVTNNSSASVDENVVVQLDGRVLGFCSPKQARVIADTLRHWKVEGKNGVPVELEIGYIPNSHGGQYPGVYMFSQAARMIRPVKYLPLDREDYVGPFEQPFMSIACTDPEIESGVSTHVEYDPTNILSIIANMTPFSDFNQSPRNMYQCQMSKQTMGTPGTSLRYRTDNKAYRLQTGQTPVVRSPLHNDYGLDNFPNGMNAVVAVISYTGYDMDDAMILNKSAHERGFGHGTIYKTKVIALDENTRTRSSKNISKLFGFAPGGAVKAEWRNRLDEDGLPHIGMMVNEGDIIAASHSVTYDGATGTYINRDGETELHKYKESETAFVEEVRVLGSENGNEPCQAISLKLRVPRSPVIGDKFSSRHGQKGVCSQKWPAIDMPFSESGMQPDVIINPHAFPSRMTIGMFVESLAGKAGALHGLAQDCTPFRFDEANTAGNYFGEQLRKAGYNYYGNEPMYSGITGEELHADIYLGVVYYQRLRHMVNDKFQVRTTGPVTALTGQPIKGRKKGGGIRVGEMERDSLLAHGTAFLLQDRLLNCSDYTKAWICKTCGSFLATTPTVAEAGPKRKATSAVRCRRCAHHAQGYESKSEVWEDGSGIRWTGGENTTLVAVPGVLRYLDVELAAMGIKMKFDVGP